ncbi:hypothetical protein Q3G72_017044 [Acer saccharum]|nr:hypothetical protein Q3G72_017044 [Acer saccharum]
MALGPSIEGFKSCIHLVVAVDETFLKCKHQGTLFIATSLDGNNQVYPLAFGIGDLENDQSWHWFFTKLHGLIGEMDDLVFIFDRNSSIAKAVAGVFPNSLHGYIMAQIRGTDVSVAQYLIEADPTKWARSHFDGRRYCIMTTNNAECLNRILKDAQELPITKLVEHIRGLLQKWFWERREAAAKMSTPMTKHALAACNLRRSSCYDYCSHYYHKETLATAYGSSICPVGPMEEWDVPDDIQSRVVLPLKGRKPHRRPAKKHKPSRGGWMARDVGYVVFEGHSPGVYESWNECEAQINGFEGSFMKSYSVVCRRRRAIVVVVWLQSIRAAASNKSSSCFRRVVVFVVR